MTVKDELHRLIDRLDRRTEVDALDYVRWLLSDEDSLTSDELAAVQIGEDEIARGEYVTLTELARATEE